MLAYNVIHATRRLDESLRYCKQLLKTHGVVLFNELSRRADFATMTFGLTPGWWRFEDFDDRLPHGPAASPAQWTRLLEEAGFHGIGVYPHFESSAATSLQSMLIAESDGWIESRQSPHPINRPSAAPASAISLPAVAADPASTFSGDMQQRVEAYLLPVFVQVLKLAPGTMQPAEPFDHYGLESLAILEISARLEQDLGELPKTLLFEQNSVARLARYLIEHHGSAVERRLSGATSTQPDTPQAESSSRQPRPASNAHTASTSGNSDEPFAVAIVGMSGRYPGCRVARRVLG